ncbi:GH39 family glycosyl hydrolase [Murimonas intestini]|uniref:GH39 family glycosyl hydrolase n=1 Tax=Murimonas intestini TaxID=1337051 RepID=UPI00248C361F|nr:helix-turn-helix domain-containing protein [Murimonas intestini]
MKKNILGENQIMNMEFQIDKTEMIHLHQSVEILYVLEGNPEITVQDNTYQAHPEDVLVINANKKHSYRSKDDVMLGCFEINYRMLGDLLDTSQILFWCNSVVNKNAAYEDMRKIMKQIFSLYFDKNGQTQILIQSLYFQLLQVLTENFFVKSEDKRFVDEQNPNEERIAEIVNYIHSNYRRKISLNELSDQLYFSVPYLSKYIKRQLGMNFLDYVNNIRLFHAVDDLLYANQSITTVAMNNGFANAAAFTEMFKKAYNMTPSEYRQQMLAENSTGQERNQEEQKKLVEQKVSQYLDDKLIVEPQDMQHKDEYAVVDTTVREEYDPYWRSMVNIGRAADLLGSDMQENVLTLQRDLGFSYVRIWGIFSEEMMLNETSPKREYYFGRVDRVFDFLTDNKIKPYLELGFKPVALHRSLRAAIVMEKEEIPFGGIDSYENFVTAFTTHLVNRYGLEEVETWYFEQWSGEDFETDRMDGNFFPVFEMLYRVLKRHSSKIRVGGGGLGIQYGSENLTKFVKTCCENKCRPDFLTLYCYPYIKGDEDGVAYARQSTDRDFLKNQLEMAESVIQNSEMGDIKIHVSEWSSTISNRNILNDSCYKGAYIMKSVIDCLGKTDVLGYWLGSDIFAEHMDNRKILFGGCGLLSIQGIKKPAFFAYKFLNMLGKYLIYKDENGIVTTNGNSDFSIVCHNYRHLNYKYYMKSEDELEFEKLYQLYEDNQNRQVNYQLTRVKNGSYKIKTYSVNAEYGSAQEEIYRVGEAGSLSRQEIDYIKRVCTPRIQIRQCQVNSNVLNFETKMRAQEIQYIHISYLYE